MCRVYPRFNSPMQSAQRCSAQNCGGSGCCAWLLVQVPLERSDPPAVRGQTAAAVPSSDLAAGAAAWRRRLVPAGMLHQQSSRACVLLSLSVWVRARASLCCFSLVCSGQVRALHALLLAVAEERSTATDVECAKQLADERAYEVLPAASRRASHCIVP